MIVLSSAGGCSQATERRSGRDGGTTDGPEYYQRSRRLTERVHKRAPGSTRGGDHQCRGRGRTVATRRTSHRSTDSARRPFKTASHGTRPLQTVHSLLSNRASDCSESAYATCSRAKCVVTVCTDEKTASVVTAALHCPVVICHMPDESNDISLHIVKP